MSTLKVKRGDTWIFTAKWRDLADDPIDLEGCTVRQWVTLKGDAAAVLELGTVSGEITLVEDADETPGLLCNTYTRVEAADMAELEPGCYEFDQEVTFVDGQVLSTDTIGLTVIEDKTL